MVLMLTQKDNPGEGSNLRSLGSGFSIIFDDTLSMDMWFNNHLNFLSQPIGI